MSSTYENMVDYLQSAISAKDEVKAAVDELLSLKAKYKSVSGKDWTPGDNSKQANPKSNVKGETIALESKLTKKEETALKDAAAEGLDIKIKTCGDLIRRLKSEKAEKEIEYCKYISPYLIFN